MSAKKKSLIGRLQRKIVSGREYYYLQRSFRWKGRVRTRSLYVGDEKDVADACLAYLAQKKKCSQLELGLYMWSNIPVRVDTFEDPLASVVLTGASVQKRSGPLDVPCSGRESAPAADADPLPESVVDHHVRKLEELRLPPAIAAPTSPAPEASGKPPAAVRSGLDEQPAAAAIPTPPACPAADVRKERPPFDREDTRRGQNICRRGGAYEDW
jgi:hypothetical protein